MPRTTSTSVAILGAGLTGMAAAHALDRSGIPYRIFEQQERPGGHAVTVEEDGFRFDRTGHLLHLRDPEIRAQVLGWIGGDALEIERRSVVYSHGVYTRYPFQANTFGLPPEVAYECVTGFVRALLEPPASRPRTFEEFCLAHFGEGISRHFMVPYNTRLWGVAPSEITADWCERFVPRPSLEDVIAGAVGMRSAELGYNARFLYPRRGIGELAEGMARGLPVELGRAPRSVDFRSRTLRFEDEVVSYDALVSTAPLSALVRLLEDPPEPVTQAADRLRCTHLYYLDVALDTPCPKPFHWVYVPEARYPFYRVGCYTNFSEAMAPPGKAGLYVELASREPPELDVLLPRVVEGLVGMGLVARASDVRFARVRRLDHAYVIFDHAYYGSLEVLRPFLGAERIVSTGRYGGWNYSSMEDALRFGRDAAREAAAIVGTTLPKEVST